MSQFTTKDSAEQVDTYSVTTSSIQKKSPDVCTPISQKHESLHPLSGFFLTTTRILLLAHRSRATTCPCVDAFPTDHPFNPTQVSVYSANQDVLERMVWEGEDGSVIKTIISMLLN